MIKEVEVFYPADQQALVEAHDSFKILKVDVISDDKNLNSLPEIFTVWKNTVPYTDKNGLEIEAEALVMDFAFYLENWRCWTENIKDNLYRHTMRPKGIYYRSEDVKSLIIKEH